MRYRPFGTTGMSVSEIGFGCARIGGIFHTGPKSAILDALLSAHDNGIIFFDTSDLYAQGESERLLGEAFADRRHDVILASKVGYVLPARRKLVAGLKPVARHVIRALGLRRGGVAIAASGQLRQDFSASHIVRALEASLRRLRTDYLDLYQLHSPPSEQIRSGDFLEPLERLKRDGKLRFYGVSCETTEDAELCLSYSEISSIQVRLSVLAQEPVDSVLPRAAARGLAVIARECFAGGVLAKPHAAMPAPGELSGRVQACAALARASGRTLTESALKFVLSTPGVSVALVGMRSEEQLRANLRELESPSLTASELVGLRAIAA